MQLNRFCASGLEAVNIAAQKVASGWEDLVFAGGVESMSRVPMGSDGGAWAMDPETNYDTSFIPQGIGADLIATVEGFSREDVDAYAAALAGARRRGAARRASFDDSVVPVKDLNDHVVLDHDEFIRPGTTVETLGRPQAVVRRRWARWAASTRSRCRSTTGSRGSTTSTRRATRPASSTAPSLRADRQREDRRGARPRRRGRGSSPPRVSGADPTIMLTGPAPASKKALAKAGLTVDDIDLVEINEAFAAVVLRFVKDMGLDMEKVNVNGGAIAMGHPLGATGGDDPRHAHRRAASAPAAATASPRCASAAAWASRPSSSASRWPRRDTRSAGSRTTTASSS